MNKKSSLPALASILTLAFSKPVFAQTTNALPLANPSFESQSVAAGSYTVENPAGWSVAGPAAGVVAIIHPAAGDNRFTTYPPPGLAGANYCQIYSEAAGDNATVYQDSGFNYQAGVTYKLSAVFGWESNATFPNCQLVLYNSLLTAVASNSITQSALTEGAFVTNCLTYTATGNEGGNGDILVGINLTGGAAATSLDFDNISLTGIFPPGPLILVPPASQNVLVSNSVSFTVTATGTPPLRYQWQANGGAGFTNLANGTSLSGACSNVLTVLNATTNWALSYRVIVTNSAGSVTSSPPASLTVLPTVRLLDVAIGSAANAQTGAAVLGSSGDVWNGLTGNASSLVDATGQSFSGLGLSLSAQGLNNDPGGTPMDAATTPLMQHCAFGYNAPSTVTVSLTGLGAYINSGFTLVVYGAIDANQGDSLTLSGATGGNSQSTLTTLADTRQISAGIGHAYNTFTGILTNGTLTIHCANNGLTPFCGLNGFQLLLSPAPNPAIYSQPQSQTIPPGGVATFSVTALGTGPLAYQWQINTGGGFANLANGGQITGATNATLTVSNVIPWVSPNLAASYQVIVSGSAGSVTSAPVSLNVAYLSPGADVNGAIYQAFANGGGTVYLGPGTFYGGINMWANVTLAGAGTNTIIAGGTVTQGSSDSSGFYRDNITLQNLVIDGQISCSSFSVGGSGPAGIYFGGFYPIQTHNLTFNNVEVRNTSIAMQLVNVANINLNNCNFHDNGIGFSHSIYFTGDYAINMSNCVSSWTRTGDGAHLDFSSDVGVPNTFTQCEFNGAAGLGILNQAYNGSGNDIHVNGCKFQFNGQSGGDGDAVDTDLNGYIAGSRFEYNHGNGATIRDNVGLFFDYFNGNASGSYWTYSGVAYVSQGANPPNEYDACLADGVCGPNNTADWSTSYLGSGSAAEGVVDFNANHSTNGLLTWSTVSSTGGAHALTLYYSNGSSNTVTMQLIVNGLTTNLVSFPPTGGWTTYSNVSVNAVLTAQNNSVKMQVAYPGATSPVLSSLVVNDSVPAAPAAPANLAYLALSNAPQYDLSCWIQLTWDPSPGATYYNILRNGWWIATGVTSNSFIDRHVWTSGSPQSYTVIAVNAGGGNSSQITAYSFTGFPISLSAAATAPGTVVLTCNPSLNAQYYNAYRATNAAGPFTYIGVSGSNVFVDTMAPGGMEYYYMTADNGLTESLPSPQASATVTPLPLAITNEPVSQTSYAGGSVSFSVGAVGSPPLTYQWQAANPNTRSFTNLVNGGNFSGANNNMLVISDVTASQALAYQVIVSDNYGSITSAPAILTVLTTTPIGISNYSFENPAVSEGSYAICSPAGLPGWSISGLSGAVVAVVNPGASDGRGFGANPAGLDGSNFGQIFCDAPGGQGIVYQDTGVKYQPGVAYQLTAAFGAENGAFATGAAMALYNSSLTPVASKVISASNLVSGAFTNLTLNYTATGGEGGNGDILVGFSVPASAGNAWFDFDDVTLNATTSSASTNACLSALTLAPTLTFTPPFTSNVLNYAATLAYGSAPTLTITSASVAATNWLICNGATNLLTCGCATPLTGLKPGTTNLAQVRVTAANGVTTQGYTLSIFAQPNLAARPHLTNRVTGGVLQMSWDSQYLGYRLIQQVNHLSNGVSANLNDWVALPGSTLTNAMTIPISTNGSRFFRLVFP